MHGAPAPVRGRSARYRLRHVLGAAVMGVLVAASCRGLRLTPPDHDSGQSGRALAATPAVATTTSTTQPRTTPVALPKHRVFILSDSVIWGARYAVPDALPGWDVVLDGKGGRLIDAGVAELRYRQSDLGSVVVVQLGNNYLGDERAFATALDELYAIVGPDRWLILLHVYPIQANRAEVNGAIDALAAAHPNVRVADWPAIENANPTTTYADHLHLNMRGARVMAEFLRAQVDEVAGRAPPR